jgi:hypothetical protein
MIISYSELSRFDTCDRQYYYNFILGLQPVDASEAIDTGTKGHKLLQIFYTELQTGKTKEKALATVIQKAQEVIFATGMPDSRMLKAWLLVENYIRDNEFKTEAVLVENRFLFPFSMLDDDPEYADVQVGFTPDVVFKRSGDFYDVEDFKFVGREWSAKKKERFQQAKLYQLFLRRMGYQVTRSIIRFFNTQTGRISYDAAAMTDAEEAIIIRDFVAGVKELVDFKRQPPEKLALSRRTTNVSTCQYCFYSFPCTLEAQGKDATKTFKSEFITRDYDYGK